MPDSAQIHASMWLMVAIQSIGAMDLPGHGPRKLPAPKTYIAIVILWSLFGIMVDAGAQRAAVVMSWVTVLAAMIIGPFGKVGTDFLGLIAKNFATQPSGIGSIGGGTVA